MALTPTEIEQSIEQLVRLAISHEQLNEPNKALNVENMTLLGVKLAASVLVDVNRIAAAMETLAKTADSPDSYGLVGSASLANAIIVGLRNS